MCLPNQLSSPAYPQPSPYLQQIPQNLCGLGVPDGGWPNCTSYIFVFALGSFKSASSSESQAEIARRSASALLLLWVAVNGSCASSLSPLSFFDLSFLRLQTVKMMKAMTTAKTIARGMAMAVPSVIDLVTASAAVKALPTPPDRGVMFILD